MNFSDFPLRPEILQAVEDAGYRTPTPIQEQAIPVILTGEDLLGIAQTGTGKTAAFVLPMIERLASGRAKARMPRSLILSPTRELATQTANYFETYGKHLNLSMALLIGGVGMDEQWRLLDRGVDVLIATPGRLLDQFERGKVLLGGVTILVIDEADRMLDMGFMPDVERLVNLVSKRRQTLMFSATMPAEIRRLANAFLNHPKEVQATPPATMAERIEDHVAVVPPRHKFKALRRLIEDQGIDNALIFCNRKREVASLRRQMERSGYSVRDIHGDLDQAQRSAALDAFKRGEIAYLVATDVAARGLDIVMLPCVVNYDIPTHAEDYVHRLGRTGRAGQAGRAFTLVLPDERRFVEAITRLTGRVIPRLEIAGLDGTELAATARSGRARGRAAADDPGRAAQPGVEPQPSAETGRTRARRARPERRPTGVTPEPARAVRGHGQPEAPLPAKHRDRRDGPAADRPVVGMGDHVPLFMRRPVPHIAALPEAAED
jgi:superfamily II DNA/RNA helicase